MMSADIQTQYFDHQHVTVIDPSQGWRKSDLKRIVYLHARPA